MFNFHVQMLANVIHVVPFFIVFTTLMFKFLFKCIVFMLKFQ